ncbi:MAG: hypothetical protein QOD75_2716 [Blastocatellia bacterium]|jgi:hypothetical protein|nr:hypothetical protein [Blastocatellia bacterium]
MRKVIYPAIAISTLIPGLGACLLWFYFVPVTVSLCDLAHHRDWYHKRIVRVAAPASGLYEGVMIVDSGCRSSDSAAVIMLDESYVPQPEVQAFLQPILMDSEPQIRKADVVVIGRFDKNATMGCFSPEFGIRVTNVELKSAISTEPFPRRNE